MQVQILPDDGGIVWEGTDLRVLGQTDREYSIRFTDERGCEIERKLQIRIRKNTEIHVPNAFSPNGDQINDVWQPLIGHGWTVISAAVFDRWGNQVYQTGSDPVSWDGRHMGQVLNPGVYIWHLRLQAADGAKKELSGELTMIQ